MGKPYEMEVSQLYIVTSYSSQSRFRVRDTFLEADSLRETLRFLVPPPRLRNITVHLGELAEIMGSNSTSNIAFFIPLRRLDLRRNRQGLSSPLPCIGN